jgi:hypothetical protein
LLSLAGRGIQYPVGLDNESKAWEAWAVESWPTHFLVPRPKKAGAVLLKKGDPHVGDRNHDLLERTVLTTLLSSTSSEATEPLAVLQGKLASVVPLNRAVLYDLELFCGLEHREKNYATESGCDDGACVFRPKGKPGQVSATVLFDRNSHEGLMTFAGESREEWMQTAEYVQSPAAGAGQFGFEFKVAQPAATPTNGGVGVGDAGVGGVGGGAKFAREGSVGMQAALSRRAVSAAPVAVYLVAEPVAAGQRVTVTATDQATGAGSSVVVAVADRHLVGVFPAHSTLELVLAGDSCKIYTLYLTTELPA